MESKVRRSGTKNNTNKKLTLTKGEELLLRRRRLGWKQGQMAAHYGVSVFNYKLSEYGRDRKLDCGPQQITTLAPHEKCLIYRKRAKKTQEETADMIGITRGWLRLQEIGKVSCEKLLAFWEAEG